MKAVALLAALGALATGSAAGAAQQPRLNVFAAASLTEVLGKIDARQSYSFGGSNTLAFQIRQGAPADVFASAAPQWTQDLFARGLVEKPVTLVSNKLVLIVPRSNPAGIESVFDLKRKDVKLVIGGPAVPVGVYTRDVLRRLGLSSVLSKVVSQEPDVKGVVGKVALGQAEAGFVYTTDARPVAGDVRVVAVPAFAQPKVRYEIAIVKSSRNLAAARAWVKRLLTDKRVRKRFADAGFSLR